MGHNRSKIWRQDGTSQ